MSSLRSCSRDPGCVVAVREGLDVEVRRATLRVHSGTRALQHRGDLALALVLPGHPEPVEVHVPPKMTTHEHANDSEARTPTLRIEFGIRFFYESLWKGFEKAGDARGLEAVGIRRPDSSPTPIKAERPPELNWHCWLIG